MSISPRPLARLLLNSVKFQCHIQFDRVRVCDFDRGCPGLGRPSLGITLAKIGSEDSDTRSERISRFRAITSAVAFHFTVTSYITFSSDSPCDSHLFGPQSRTAKTLQRQAGAGAGPLSTLLGGLAMEEG